MNHTCRRPPSLRSTSYQPQINKSSPLFDSSSTDLSIPTKISAIRVVTSLHAPVEILAFRCSSLTRRTRLLIVLKRVTNQNGSDRNLVAQRLGSSNGLGSRSQLSGLARSWLMNITSKKVYPTFFFLILKFKIQNFFFIGQCQFYLFFFFFFEF